MGMVKAFIVCILLVVGLPVRAATIEVRPELVPYLKSLMTTYVPLASVDGGLPQSDLGDFSVILLSGQIKKGDAARLEKVMATAGFTTVVFDSPGGNFLEGIKIGELLQGNLSSQDPSLGGVYVLKGHECLSACALAFSLTAASRGVGDENYDVRYIEDGAVLGFHMGSFSEQQNEQTAKVKSIMDLTYSIVAAYSKLIKGNLNPPILLEEALKHRDAKSFFYLHGGQRSLSLGFTPVTRSVTAAPLYSYAMNLSALDQICRTLIMSTRLPKTLVTYDYLFINGQGPSGAKDSLEDVLDLRGGRTVAGAMASGETCYVTRRDDRSILISVTPSNQPRLCNSLDRNGYNSDAWCASKNDAQRLMTVGLLADTAFCNMGQFRTEFEYWGSDFSNGYNAGTTKDILQWKRRILQDVNIRRSPSLKAEVVGGLSSGDEVQVTNCRLVNDTQGVWYQIKSNSGTGWISARFALPALGDVRASLSR